jgi:hypothetical protein
MSYRKFIFSLPAMLAIAMFLPGSPAQAAVACGVPQSLTWGFESWTMGQKVFTMTLGDGLHNVTVSSLYGFLAANAHGDATNPDYLRQSLVTISYPGAASVSPGSAGAAPDAYSINEVDGSLFAINVKQKGKDGVHLPINLMPPVPITLQGGKLLAIVNNVTYGSDTVISSPPEESIDVEVHLVVWFTEACQ